MTRKRKCAEAQHHEQGPVQLLGPGSAGPDGVDYTSFALQGCQYSIGAPCLCSGCCRPALRAGRKKAYYVMS